jgi:hypothetical protein
VRTILGVTILTLSVGLFAATPAPTLKIKSVDARLFYSDTGTLSEPVTPQMALRNVIIGAGDVPEPSTSTLVDVVVEGTAGSFDPKWVVQLVVKESGSGKVIARASKHVSVLSNAGISHVGFWLPYTGCESLDIAASVGKASMKNHVAFNCGE